MRHLSISYSLRYLLPAVLLLVFQKHPRISGVAGDILLWTGWVLVIIGLVYLVAAMSQTWVDTVNRKHEPTIEQMRLIGGLSGEQLRMLQEVLDQRLVLSVNLKNPLEYRVMYWTPRGSLTLPQMKEALTYALSVGSFPDFPVIHGMGDDTFRRQFQAFSSLMVDIGLAVRDGQKHPRWSVERAADLPKILLLDKWTFEEA